MRYLLCTTSRYPHFYRADGTTVAVELNYVQSKTLSDIDENGELVHLEVSGTPPTVNDIWMVDSVEHALSVLSGYGVYPFKSKSIAKENAKRLGLKTFKYIPVP